VADLITRLIFIVLIVILDLNRCSPESAEQLGRAGTARDSRSSAFLGGIMDYFCWQREYRQSKQVERSGRYAPVFDYHKLSKADAGRRGNI